MKQGKPAQLNEHYELLNKLNRMFQLDYILEFQAKRRLNYTPLKLDFSKPIIGKKLLAALKSGENKKLSE